MDDGQLVRSQAGAARRQQTAADVDSPVTTRSGRALGQIGGKVGPGYSPYARRTVAHPAVSRYAGRATNGDDGSDDMSDDMSDDDDEARQQDRTPVQQRRTGLLGAVGRAIGSIFRSSSTRQLPVSSSLRDVREQLERDERRPAGKRTDERRGARVPSGLSRSSTMHDLADAAASPSQPTTRSGAAGGARTRSSIPPSSSLSALATLNRATSPRPAPSSLARSSHATLQLPNGSAHTPAFLERDNRSRQASPALSSTSLVNRSPSPVRNNLAGSMSAFNLAGSARMPVSPAGSSVFARQQATDPASAFGLTSRSPFASHRSPSIPRSASTTGGSLSGGHALFPYSSTVQRGVSPAPSLPTSHSTSMLHTKRSFQALNGSPRSRTRVGSPLNPQFGQRAPSPEPSVGGMLESGAERARKRQLVWDPEKGLISREALEHEQAKNAPPLPKNEAERILEVLEGMGKTPLGEAKRAAMRPKNIHVPLPSTSTLSRSASTPYASSASPYGRRPARANDPRGKGPGLESQLQAREERRRALIEKQHEERELERREDEERAQRKRRLQEEEERLLREEEEDEAMLSPVEDNVPRRKTRSMAKAESSKTPIKAKATPSKGKSKALQATSAVKSRSTRSRKAPVAVEDEEMNEREEAALSPRRKTRASARSKSPAPPPARSPSPSPESPPQATEAAAKETAPAEDPTTHAAATSAVPSRAGMAQRSSMRPGKSHSSRQHESSSRVFSAREEDLPPVDESDLGKIKLPAIKFPANFSFGGAAPLQASQAGKPIVPIPVPVVVETVAKTPAETSEGRIVEIGDKADKSSASSSKPSDSTSLLSRLGPPPSSAPASLFATKKPAAASEKDAVAYSTDMSKATFSFGKPPSAPSDFFSKPPEPNPFSAISSTPSSGEGAKAPNFFGAVLADKSTTPEKAAPAPRPPKLTFGKSADPKKTEASSSSNAAAFASTSSSSTSANPFAAFGKPVAEIVKESASAVASAKETAEAPKAPAAPAFGSFGSGSKGLSIGEKADEKKNGTTASSSTDIGFNPFSFGKPAATEAKSTPAAPPFSFGATAAGKEQSSKSDGTTEKPAVGLFSFKPSATAPTASTAAPSFSFGAASSSAKSPTNDGAKPAFSFGATAPSAPSAPASTVGDEDSGMEDTDTAAAPAQTAPESAKPPGFSFTVNSPAAAVPTFGVVNGGKPSSGFAFGASTGQKEASPAPASIFGAPPSAAPAFGGFSPSPSPAPPSPAPGTGFTFGQRSAQPAAPATSAPGFSFGAPAAANPSPFGASAGSSTSFGAAPTSPAASKPSFTFGSAIVSSAPPAQPLLGGTASAPMSQTLSAPGFNSSGAVSPFGSGAQTPNSGAPTPFAFGAPAAAANGSQPATPGANASPFAFGSGATPSFGGFGNGASGAAPAANPFAAPAAPGGVASAPGTPTGNAPGAGGLFNIGSGGDESPNKSGRKIAGLRRTRRP